MAFLQYIHVILKAVFAVFFLEGVDVPFLSGPPQFRSQCLNGLLLLVYLCLFLDQGSIEVCHSVFVESQGVLDLP